MTNEAYITDVRVGLQTVITHYGLKVISSPTAKFIHNVSSEFTRPPYRLAPCNNDRSLFLAESYKLKQRLRTYKNRFNIRFVYTSRGSVKNIADCSPTNSSQVPQYFKTTVP